MTDEQRRMTKEERVLKRIREAGVEACRIPDERLPGRPARPETNTEKAIEQIRKAVVEYGGDVRVGRIPDEDLPRRRTRITVFGEARRRVPEIGEHVEVRVEDGSWRRGYRAVTGPTDVREIPEEHLRAAGVDPREGGTVVWITDEERWRAAAEAGRVPDGMPWPVEQLRGAPPPEG